MKITYLKVFISTLFLAFSFGLESNANADLVAGSLSADARADQDVEIAANSPLSAFPDVDDGDEFSFSSIGSFTVAWDATNTDSTTISAFSAIFNEVHPDFGPYTLLAAGDGPGAGSSGTLSNIVVDVNDELVSADMTILTTFSLMFTGPGTGNPLLYTQSQAEFVGRIATDGSGIDFASPDPMNDDLDIFLATPLPNDPLAAISFNRTVTGITAVPEPATCVFGGVLGLMVALRRRKGRVVNGQ